MFRALTGRLVACRLGGLCTAVFCTLATAGIAAEPKPPATPDPPVAEAPAAPPTLAGSWSGTLNVGLVKLRLVVRITADGEGKYKALMDSIDQGANGLTVDAVTFADGNLKLKLVKLDGVFEGKANEGMTQFTGTWKQRGNELPLVLARTDTPPQVRRPQTPQKPYPYREEEVKYAGGGTGNELAGTLTLPQGDGPFPAVLLIGGSGPQDRDESIVNHKPFWVLADHLTRRGVAVLRVDDRGVGQSSGEFATATTLDFAADARASLRFLAARPEIDSHRIGLAGHSEGGLIAPLVAAETSDVAFVVLLAGPGVTGEEIMYRQGQLILESLGAGEKDRQRQRATQQAMFAAVKEVQDTAALKERLREVIENLKSELTEEERQQVDKQEAATAAQIDAVSTPWFRFFLTYDPAPTLQKLRCPVLAIVGQWDLQVEPAQNIPKIKAALEAGKNPDYSVQELKGLNHLFQSCQTGAVAEYAQIEETFAPAALEIISDWIVAHTKK